MRIIQGHLMRVKPMQKQYYLLLECLSEHYGNHLHDQLSYVQEGHLSKLSKLNRSYSFSLCLPSIPSFVCSWNGRSDIGTFCNILFQDLFRVSIYCYKYAFEKLKVFFLFFNCDISMRVPPRPKANEIQVWDMTWHFKK